MTGRDSLPLRVEGLVIEARDGRRLLELPRLELPAGGTLAVTGPSGAGKSSLLHALAGLLRPAQGKILWGATEIAELSDPARARFRRERVGLVFQDFLLFEELGAAGNAAVAASFAPARERAAIRSRADGWLGRLGLGQRTEPSIRTYSGGERQRVAVARALAHAPAVLLADEPTASLDRASADRLIDDLLEMVEAEGCTLVAVTHDAQLAQRLGRELRLSDGRVVEPALV
ncbi:MAG TPA: ATP-binding cassette domain-containing protein [Rubellimicrobium sp.]|jgi:predicted ABC-type transport system involved in lysophospholipase L1 biosynthesis ATPase subunit|nr:ATP-binding cassette domain-containing protein [Rubellimicrobium sp.]